MKKFLLLLASATLFASAGCENCDVLRDYTCYNIRFLITDADGNNMMDPEFEGNILDNGVYAEYNGENYHLMTELPQTRAEMPHWWGLSSSLIFSPTQPVKMLFGEFSPTSDYRGETFTIHWGDGTSDVVKFDMYITGTDCEPTVHRKLWFNGESIPVTDQSGYLIEVVK